MTVILQAGYLTLWGVAILLCWTATLRLFHMAHIVLAARGSVPAPRRMMPPMNPWNDVGMALISLAAGNAALIAFATTSFAALRLPPWLNPLNIAPWLEVVRIAAALAVLLFFLTRVAERPRYKLAWTACWAVFSFAVVHFA